MRFPILFCFFPFYFGSSGVSPRVPSKSKRSKMFWVRPPTCFGESIIVLGPTPDLLRRVHNCFRSDPSLLLGDISEQPGSIWGASGGHLGRTREGLGGQLGSIWGHLGDTRRLLVSTWGALQGRIGRHRVASYDAYGQRCGVHKPSNN